MTELLALTRGQRYRVTYRLDNHRRDRVFVGTYLGPRHGSSGRDLTPGAGDGELEFNLRPDAGTSWLPASAVKEAVPVPSSVPHSQPVLA